MSESPSQVNEEATPRTKAVKKISIQTKLLEKIDAVLVSHETRLNEMEEKLSKVEKKVEVNSRDIQVMAALATANQKDIEALNRRSRAGWLTISNLPMKDKMEASSCIAHLFTVLPIHANEAVPVHDLLAIEWKYMRDIKYGVLNVLFKHNATNSLLSPSVQKRIKDFNDNKKTGYPVSIAVCLTNQQNMRYYQAVELRKKLIMAEKLRKQENPAYVTQLVKIDRNLKDGAELYIGNKKYSISEICVMVGITEEGLQMAADDARKAHIENQKKKRSGKKGTKGTKPKRARLEGQREETMEE